MMEMCKCMPVYISCTPQRMRRTVCFAFPISRFLYAKLILRRCAYVYFALTYSLWMAVEFASVALYVPCSCCHPFIRKWSLHVPIAKPARDYTERRPIEKWQQQPQDVLDARCGKIELLYYTMLLWWLCCWLVVPIVVQNTHKPSNKNVRASPLTHSRALVRASRLPPPILYENQHRTYTRFRCVNRMCHKMWGNRRREPERERVGENFDCYTLIGPNIR